MADKNNNNGKPKKRKYLPHSPVRKGSWPLRPGVQGFFITCDGGRERQATNEALNLLDSFYEELLDGKDSGPTSRAIPIKPVNKITKFEDSDSSGEEGESPCRSEDIEADKHAKECEDKTTNNKHEETENKTEDKTANRQHEEIEEKNEDKTANKQHEETEEESENKPAKKQYGEIEEDNEEKPTKKQCIEVDANSQATDSRNGKEKSIDDLIEEELKEMGDRNKRRFLSLDSGCNGCIFIQMHKSDGKHGPASIVQHMMSSAALTKKHMSRFILRVLPAEITCYASEEEISKAIKALIEQHFPTEAPTPQKFAVLYEARANTGVDRMKIINAVAKSVPEPHKVDLNKPDKTIIVQIAKTICLVGVAERYKELSKYNLRQLTAPQQ
ncbi:THUMP domain-containing protein 1 homolog isoform X2 [Asparagus officinalis]|uniref:THUMP domain-containing protein 1 homolog isoform X2 n=1 Tax=Asparagus officinalis TaxID=4686 RepID=UPI00098E3B8F|nr:THUMP domain-containing protein 1 homolog isoform X2 [Asparagus officinalis]